MSVNMFVVMLNTKCRKEWTHCCASYTEAQSCQTLIVKWDAMALLIPLKSWR